MATFTSTFAVRLRAALTLRCIPFTSVRFRDDEELRDAPDVVEALSALFAGKIRVIDARMAELAAMRRTSRSASPRDAHCGRPVWPAEH